MGKSKYSKNKENDELKYLNLIKEEYKGLKLIL